MSTYTSEPGTRLAGRYRLVDQLVSGNGWSLWKAIDETLARPVSILTFAPSFPRIQQVVTAARAASRLTDPRMAQVFDVEDGNGQVGQAYVVLEFVGGDSLTELLANGPLDLAQACSLICDAARALAGAHALGQAHLRLTPDALRWSRGSGIKITGMGIDAALAGEGMTGAAIHDPSLADTISLAALLYATLTGYWPGDEPTDLPPAPYSDGMVATPAQINQAVSPDIDDVIVRALLQQPTRRGRPIESPAEFADALAAVAPPTPLPEPAPGPAGYGSGFNDHWSANGRGPSGTAPYEPPSGNGYGPSAPTGYQYAAPTGYQGAAGHQGATGYQGAVGYDGGTQSARRGGGRGKLILALVAVVVIGVVVYLVGFNKPAPPASASTGPTTSASAAPAGTVLPISGGVTTFNPDGTPAGSTENQVTVQGAIGTNPASPWTTQVYYSPLAQNKPGTGLLINMGKPVKLSEVDVTFSSGGTTTASIYLGNNPADTKATGISAFTKVAGPATDSGQSTFKITGAGSQATGQYVLIWLTSLPQLSQRPTGVTGGSEWFRGSLYGVVVKGSAAPANS
jgi:hypothetical protein